MVKTIFENLTSFNDKSEPSKMRKYLFHIVHACVWKFLRRDYNWFLSLRFMEDLQTEVQELEFHEFSKGLDFISQVDFAKILLRYTYLQSEE